MKKKLRPLHDRVLIKRFKKTQTESGIYLPGTADNQSDQGTVVARGPGKRSEKGDLISPSVQEGQKVFFGKYAGQKVELDEDEEYVIVRDEDILALLED